jgi:putative transposase
LWVADITQHATSEGWLYLAVVMDTFSRKVVGWAMAERLYAELVVSALDMAVRNRRPDKGLVHHSDYGSQCQRSAEALPYTSLEFGKRLREADILGSMGRVGNALDNAVAESFFATLQTVLLDRQKWTRRSALRLAIFDFTEVFYNRQRRHSSLDYLSPAEFGRRWLASRSKNDKL